MSVITIISLSEVRRGAQTLTATAFATMPDLAADVVPAPCCLHSASQILSASSIPALPPSSLPHPSLQPFPTAPLSPSRQSPAARAPAAPRAAAAEPSPSPGTALPPALPPPRGVVPSPPSAGPAHRPRAALALPGLRGPWSLLYVPC